MLLLQDKDYLKVVKRGGHSACFNATMLTNMVIQVTFGNLRAQQISLIIFPRSMLYYTVWLSLIIYSSTSHIKCLQIPCISFYINWTCAVGPLMSLSVVFISCATIKVALDSCFFFSVIEDNVLIEIMK